MNREKQHNPYHGCTGLDLFIQPRYIIAIQSRKNMIPAGFTIQEGPSVLEALLF